ncbi:exopolysaccharide biosynthesis polyprenyl glycosylphosphotransferase [Candidatus Saccharibacteria bacterium]|nr:exopolysaccharide biosynthesis polyprenyl glycosylphosphotransferase [Candidatus Saccharibacteria bacterium]
MKKDPGLVYRVILMVGDIVAIIASFLLAYLFRIHIDQKPYYFEVETGAFITTICFLLPIWVLLMLLLGLYNKTVILNRSRLPETLRLLVASILGIMALITYDFFTEEHIFPTRLVAVYAMILCFVVLFIMRFIIRRIRMAIIRHNKGTLRAIVIGNNINTTRILEHIANFPEDGFSLAAVVSNKKYIPTEYQGKRFTSLKEALKWAKADVIFQTDEDATEHVYSESIANHLLYYFIPSETALSSHIGEVELIGDTPAIFVKVTPLIGVARFVKRAMDIVLGSLILIVALIPMAIIWLIVKLSDIHHSAIYSEYRLSRYNKKVRIYKFRSMKPEYSGMSPEEAFTKMGKPQLIEKYRKNGDSLPNDPRITHIGALLRATSLDELPQLFNVVKGDISLVGPRALVPGELRDYGDRSLLLSVKSGLTGLAQVSGRRDISFEERRALDLYYIQNWSLWMDISILFKTIGAVFTRKGAK